MSNLDKDKQIEENELKESKSNKKEATKLVSDIKVGATDISGNKVTNVLAKYNEFVIYEIDHPDINTRIRVLIEGYTDESEMKLQSRFNEVKQKYIEAKGILLRSTNYGMMKHSIAHTLATCLNSQSIEGNNRFDQLIDQIKKEHASFLKNRCLYLIPCIFAVMFLFIVNIIIYIVQMDLNTKVMLISTSLLAVSLGGSLSILINAKSSDFEEFTLGKHYLILGLERWLLACIAGAVAFIGVKSGIVFPSFANSNHWAFMSILVLAGFSESLVPSILGKINDQKNDS